MKKIIILTGILFISLASFSQVSWNVKAGVNLSNYYSVDGDTPDFKPGFKAGVGMEYSISELFSIQPSLMVSMKGAKEKVYVDEVEYTGNVDYTANPVYLELPVMAAFRFKMNDNNAFVLSAGPYLAYGIAGKLKAKIPGESESINIFGSDTTYKRFDAGLGAGLGFEFGKFLVGLDAQFGFAKVMDNNDAKNLNLSLGIGYKF